MPEERKGQKERDLRMATAHLRQQRETRYTVPIEIEISGIAQNGEVFHERMFTRDVSEWGCGFVTSVELKTDNIIALRVASRDAAESARARQSLFQVRGVLPEEHGWLVGARKMDDGNVWGADLEKIAKPVEGALKAGKDWGAESGEPLPEDADQ